MFSLAQCIMVIFSSKNPNRISVFRHTSTDVVIWHSDGARCYRKYPHTTAVTHWRKQWVAVKKVKLGDGDVRLTFGGTELQDGLWTHLKQCLPRALKTSSDEARETIDRWVAYWSWRYRRGGVICMFTELGAAVRSNRKAACMGD